jgi:hypothetical protein
VKNIERVCIKRIFKKPWENKSSQIGHIFMGKCIKRRDTSDLREGIAPLK